MGNIKTLIDFNNKINTIITVYAKKLDFKTWKTNINVQKIGKSRLTAYKMIIGGLQILNKFDKASFLKNIFIN